LPIKIDCRSISNYGKTEDVHNLEHWRHCTFTRNSNTLKKTCKYFLLSMLVVMQLKFHQNLLSNDDYFSTVLKVDTDRQTDEEMDRQQARTQRAMQFRT